MTYDDDNDDDL